MIRILSSLALVIAAALSLTITTQALAANGDYRVEARLRTGTPLEAKGSYRERIVGNTLRQRFTVELNGAVPGSQHEVRINGNVFTTITANALGHAEVQFASTVVDDNPGDNKPPLPTDFPRINAGDTLSVGALSGNFAAR